MIELAGGYERVMPLSPLLRRVARLSTGAGKYALGTTLGDLRLEDEGRSDLRSARGAIGPTLDPDTPEARRDRIREEIRRERAHAQRRAAEA
jgi:hypothetical protein